MFNGPNTHELQNPFIHGAFFVSELNKIRSNLNWVKSMSP